VGTEASAAGIKNPDGKLMVMAVAVDAAVYSDARVNVTATALPEGVAPTRAPAVFGTL
jgi:hypothetical protein